MTDASAETASAQADSAEAAARCGARLRTGGVCALPPTSGKRRCFQHGGALGSGAPAGNQNNWQGGFYGREMKAERRWINGLIRRCLQTLREIDGKGER